MNKKRLIGYLFVTMSVGCIQAQEQKSSVPEYKLWYDCPAQVWTEALPLGNGRLGAMVYGTPGTEQIQLNEESIWAGRPNNNANPDALEYIPVHPDWRYYWDVPPKCFLRLVVFVLCLVFHIPWPPNDHSQGVMPRSIPVRDSRTIACIRVQKTSVPAPEYNQQTS